jgi:hypothetical protein
VDLDRMNEEIRTKVYLSYFSNARGQVDEQRRRSTFLKQLKDEEGFDPHFRIKAKQVFEDPQAYKKLMPWIDRLMEIASTLDVRPDENATIGEVVDKLLAEVRQATAKMDEGMNRLGGAFATGGKTPLSLEMVNLTFPVEWLSEGYPFKWRGSDASDREPLQRKPGSSKPTVDMQFHVCSVCRMMLDERRTKAQP